MIIQASESLPKSEHHIFVTLREHLDNYPLAEALQEVYPNCKVVPIDGVTEGQAITVSLGLDNANPEAPLLVAATDNGMIYNKAKYQSLIEDDQVDAIVFTFRNHVTSLNNPQMYGWVKTDGDQAAGVSVKAPISNDPFNDHAITGSFYFRKVQFYQKALERIIEKDVRVNGEYYVDSLIGELIEMNLNVKVFEVEDYIGWGTPDDYETFVYWQSFFHKSGFHPYDMSRDITVEKTKLKELEKQYLDFDQEYR